MKIEIINLVGIRCFEESGQIRLSPKCNIFVGQNNSGKSTILRGVLAWQGFSFDENPLTGDLRPGCENALYEMSVVDAPYKEGVRFKHQEGPNYNLCRNIKGSRGHTAGYPPVGAPDTNGYFINSRPYHQIIPFIARRKANTYNHTINTETINQISGTFSNLYGRIDHISGAGHPKNKAFQEAVKSIVGLEITTRASTNGKEAGFYLNDDNFVTLERMGDGVSEMVALIVEMCLERNKVFVLEEPETNLHPKGLKALLGMIRNSSESNQFIIATHSNIVVRELAIDEETKLFRVAKLNEKTDSPSEVQEVPRDPVAHMDLLRELGYEFADFDLHEGWLFLEESSAESVIREILIPLFVPNLKGRIRTFSAGGASNVEPAISEFQRLITFVHLQPVYKGRLWVRADGDTPGKEIIERVRNKFPYMDEITANTFEREQFEQYYPDIFRDKIDSALSQGTKSSKAAAKVLLLKEVLKWTSENKLIATDAWKVSASEPIEMLRAIAKVLDS